MGWYANEPLRGLRQWSMVKQRLITIVAILCLAQLAVIASRQLQDSGSDLNVLRATIESFAARIADLFSGSQADISREKSAKNQGGSKTNPIRSGELVPSMADASDLTSDKASKASNAEARASREKEPEAKKDTSTRDPFVPFFSIRNNSRSDSSVSLTEYDVSELRVAAIVSDAAGNRSASVEATDGKSFIVRVGTKIGENGGRVENITSTTIVISEPAGSTFGSQGAVTKELSLKTNPPAPSGSAN